MTKQEFLKTIIKLNNESVNVFTDLVNQIETTEEREYEQPTISSRVLTDIVHEVYLNLVEEDTNVISDYELSMQYNEVSLDRIDFNESRVKMIVEDVLNSYFKIED